MFTNFAQFLANIVKVRTAFALRASTATVIDRRRPTLLSMNETNGQNDPKWDKRQER